MESLIFYDKENDILAIHKTSNANEQFKGNIDAGQIVFDVSTKGKIIGIEVLDATSFFKEFNIDRGILGNLETAEFNVARDQHGVTINLLFESKNNAQKLPAKIAVPTNTV